MDNFAPVLILTLCRYDTQKCVESLSGCAYADKTDLFIAYDYPLNDNHWEGYRKIEAYLDKIKGFKSINIKTSKELWYATKLYESTKEVLSIMID